MRKDRERLEIETQANRPELVRWLRIVAAIVVALVLVQAFLAGRGWFINRDAIELHGYVGNVTFLAVLGQALLVYLTGYRGRTHSLLLGLSGLLVLLVTAQIGLGYSGRESLQAAAWHVPNGVLIFGLSVANLTLLLRD